MQYQYHIIRNFPKNYPWWKKTIANLIFFFGSTIIHPRKNLLSNDDLKSAKKLLKKGDIVLVGGLRRLSSMIIHGPITHAMMYIGHRRFIHAICDGVGIDSLHKIFCEYDTMAILRPKTTSKEKIKKAIAFALSKIGTPFDFEFKNDQKKFYCSELVNDSLKFAKIKTGLSKTNNQIHPKLFINSHFKKIFHSHNLNF